MRIGCMDGVTASLDATFVLEVNIVGPTFKSIWFCFSDLIFQVFHVVNGTQELIASNWSRSAEVQTLESKKVVLKF